VTASGSDNATAVSISPDAEYSASIDNTTHKSGCFSFDAVPGEIVTMVFTSTTTFKTATFDLYDQNNVTYLAYQAANGPEQTYRFVHMGNNTTPTKYYSVVQCPGSGPNAYTFQYEVGAQADGGSPDDAGDDSLTAKEITAGVDTTYADNLLGWADKLDWYKLSAASGQIVTMTLTYTAYDGASPIPNLTYTVYDQSSTTQLGTGSLNMPGGAPAVFRWMSNPTEPSVSYLHPFIGSGKDLVHTSLQIQLDQQVYTGVPGDAGDSFDTARSMTLSSQSPALSSQGSTSEAAACQTSP
jgi:hypothetical protein